MNGQIQRSTEGAILRLVIDRPAKKNALTETMYAQLTDALIAAQSDPAVRVVLITGTGELFCAGNDLGEFARASAGGVMPQQVLRFIEALARADKPLLAAAQGNAVGIGATLLLHCDHVMLAEGTLLSMPFASLALVPENASSLLLPALIGHARAFSMFALGESVDARTALAWGLANQVVPPEKLEETALGVARRLVSQPLGALIATKRLMRDGEKLAAHMQQEALAFGRRLATAEAREALAAFAERRPPDFTKLPGSGS